MGRAVSRALAALPLLAALLATAANAQQPPPPAAAPVGDPMVAGRQEFEAGEKEFNLGHYESALQHWETSYRLTSKPALLYNLGYCEKKLFERTRRLEYLEEAVERLRAYLDTTKGATEPRVVAQRDKGATELKQAEEQLTHEKAARAKGEEALAVGEEYLKKGNLDEAQAQLERFEHTPGNERAGVVRAHLLRAGIAAARGKVPEATDAYAAALSLDRSLDIEKSVTAPQASWPQAAKAFSTAQAKMGGTPVLSLTHSAPASMKPGKPLAITFTSTPDPQQIVKGVRLHYRAGGGAYSSLPQPAAVGTVSLPREFLATLLPGAKIEYYADVVDKNDAVLQHFGTELLPFVVEVEKPTYNVARKWWFWSALGGAAVVATGVGLAVWRVENPPPQAIVFQNALTAPTP